MIPPRLPLAALSTALFALAGCTVTTHAHEPVGTYEVTSAPVGPAAYEQYPHTTYEGRQVYWVNGQWGYPHESGWRYYRNEPAPLVRYRQRVETAPPARPGPYYGPQRIESAPPASAPPAVQVR